MLVCLLATFAGALLSIWAPLPQFAVGLIATTATGATLALTRGAPVIPVLMWTAMLFALAQVGYGLGLASRAFYRARHPARDSHEHSSEA